MIKQVPLADIAFGWKWTGDVNVNDANGNASQPELPVLTVAALMTISKQLDTLIRLSPNTQYTESLLSQIHSALKRPATATKEQARHLREEQSRKRAMEAYLKAGGKTFDDADLLLGIGSIELSTRAMNLLETENIATVGELAALTEDDLLEFRNCGRGTIAELRRALNNLGLDLKVKP